MGLQPVKTTVNGGIPVYQAILEHAQGGFVLDNAPLTEGNIVKAGTPMGYDESTRIAKVVKTALIHENAANNVTQYKIKKGHHFKVGDHVGITAGSAAYTITAIDATNAAYDLITVGTTLGVVVTANVTVLFQSSASGASSAAYSVTAKGLLKEDTDVAAGESVSVVLRGTVYERRVPSVNAVIKAALPHIIYSQSL